MRLSRLLIRAVLYRWSRVCLILLYAFLVPFSVRFSCSVPKRHVGYSRVFCSFYFFVYNIDSTSTLLPIGTIRCTFTPYSRNGLSYKFTRPLGYYRRTQTSLRGHESSPDPAKADR